jgi:hypothetical protein
MHSGLLQIITIPNFADRESYPSLQRVLPIRSLDLCRDRLPFDSMKLLLPLALELTLSGRTSRQIRVSDFLLEKFH